MLIQTAPPEMPTGANVFDPNVFVGTWQFEEAAVASYCNTKYQFVTEAIPGFCKTASGFCTLKTNETGLSEANKKDMVSLLCEQKFKLTRQIEEENRRRANFNPCEFIIEAGEEKVPFTDGIKID